MCIKRTRSIEEKRRKVQCSVRRSKMPKKTTTIYMTPKLCSWKEIVFAHEVCLIKFSAKKKNINTKQLDRWNIFDKISFTSFSLFTFHILQFGSNMVNWQNSCCLLTKYCSFTAGICKLNSFHSETMLFQRHLSTGFNYKVGYLFTGSTYLIHFSFEQSF